jgi:hypothetical protein
MADNDPEWCLICDQRPAEGTLRRIFLDTHAPVTPIPRGPVPQVCQTCADQVHGMPAQLANNRPTAWEYTLEDPAPAPWEDTQP